MAISGERFIAVARQPEGREGQDQDEYQRYLKLAARRLLIVSPNERGIRRMIRMVGDRHQKLPLFRVRASC